MKRVSQGGYFFANNNWRIIEENFEDKKIWITYAAGKIETYK